MSKKHKKDKKNSKPSAQTSDKHNKRDSAHAESEVEHELTHPVEAKSTAQVHTKERTKELAQTKSNHELAFVQAELTKLEQHNLRKGKKLLIILEGRDASGKDGCIKVLTEKLSPREIHIVALGKPTESDMGEWYFKRYIERLPAAGEIAFFNRSWYNRAGVEHVLKFCTDAQYKHFLNDVVNFETLLVNDGIQILKYYLDISLEEQTRRLKKRKDDPLKHWKQSPIDAVAIKNWGAYSKARDAMLTKTDHALAPWHIVRGDDKPLAHLNILRDILSRVEYAGKHAKAFVPDAKVVFAFDETVIKAGLLEN